MPYSASRIEILSSDSFRMPLESVELLREALGDERPSFCCLAEVAHVPFRGETNFVDRLGSRYFNRMQWNGEGSGATFDFFLEKVLPSTLGRADLMICWEGGDSYAGIRVRDGKVTRHKVVMQLGEEES